MSDLVRVVLLPKGAQGAAASDRQITIDMALDAKGVAIGPFPAFGRVGDFKKPETLFPFALMGDGRMDLGAHAVESARQDKLAIRAAELVPGAEILLTSPHGEETFLIDTITALA